MSILKSEPLSIVRRKKDLNVESGSIYIDIKGEKVWIKHPDIMQDGNHMTAWEDITHLCSFDFKYLKMDHTIQLEMEQRE